MFRLFPNRSALVSQTSVNDRERAIHNVGKTVWMYDAQVEQISPSQRVSETCRSGGIVCGSQGGEAEWQVNKASDWSENQLNSITPWETGER